MYSASMPELGFSVAITTVRSSGAVTLVTPTRYWMYIQCCVSRIRL